jgi:hypothetical protein
MTPPPIIAPDWPRIRGACRRERWQEASSLAAFVHANEAAYRAAFEYIEAEKAAALAALTAAWRERSKPHGNP